MIKTQNQDYKIPAYLEPLKKEIQDHLNKKVCDGIRKKYAVLNMLPGEQLNAYMQRVWDFAHPKYSDNVLNVVGMAGELFVTTVGARDVNDMHAMALEESEQFLSSLPGYKKLMARHEKSLGFKYAVCQTKINQR